MCQKCVLAGETMVPLSYDPDPARDALWKPVAYVVGYNHHFMTWLARVPYANLHRLDRSIHTPDLQGRVWLAGVLTPRLEHDPDGNIFLDTHGADGRPTSLSYFLTIPWTELAQTIQQAGEDPLTLPLDTLLSRALLREETRAQAMKWYDAVPLEIQEGRDLNAVVMGFLARQGDEWAVSKRLRRAVNPLRLGLPSSIRERQWPGDWIPFKLMVQSGRSYAPRCAHTPSDWERTVAALITEDRFSLDDIRRATKIPCPSNGEIPTFLIGRKAAVPAPSLSDWSQREELNLFHPKLPIPSASPSTTR